jgi:signal transduction histidine kinase
VELVGGEVDRGQLGVGDLDGALVGVEQLGTEVDVAIEELRGVARGMYPAILRDAGLGAALRSVARHAAIAISVEDRWQRRHSEEVELAAYFCCLEALQNAAKHAGPGTVATVCLSEENGAVRFTVEDDGDGFDPAVAGRGAGLQNITDRVAAAGGTLRIESSIGDGTRVTAELPG